MPMPDLRRALRARPYAFALTLGVLLVIANEVSRSNYLSPGRWDEMLAAFAPFAIVAMASTPAVLVDGIDVSVGPLTTFVSIVFISSLLPHGLGDAVVAIPIVLALGAAVGAANGVLIAIVRLPPVIATLGMFFMLGGLSLKVAPTPESATHNWTADLATLPGALVAIAVPVALWVVLRRTAFVRTLYAVGGDDATAFAAGVDVNAVRIAAYALGGLIAAIAGLALTSLLESADASLGTQYTLVALAAVALGGTPFGGGRGGMLGSVIGAACIFLLQDLLTSLDVSIFYLNIIYGGLLLAGVVLGSQLTVRTRPAVAA
jgi:ribose transport system permease protein